MIAPIKDETFINPFLRSGAIANISKDKLVIGWGKAQKKSARDLDRALPAFYFSDFFLTKDKPWIQYADWMEIAMGELERYLKPEPHEYVDDWTYPESQSFHQTFDELMDLLHEGRLQKGVPYVFMHSKQHMTQARLLLSLRGGLDALMQRKAYLYGHWDEESGVLGVTPELLFTHNEMDPFQVETMALAGTASLSQNEREFFLNEKERLEHRWVIEGILERVKGEGTATIGEMQVLRLRNLAHLMTPISIELKRRFDFEALVDCLHPTPALGAFPMEEGKKWLLHLQKRQPRNYYGAPIGIQSGKDGISNCYVGIRNVQWDSEGLHVGAGCGVVKQSEFNREWQEIQLKLGAIRNQLNL